MATVTAYSVRHFEFLTIRALYEIRSFELPVCTSLVTSCLGYFSLRYCHSTHLLIKIEQWSYSNLVTTFTFFFIQVFATVGAQTFTIRLAEKLRRQI